MGEWSDYFEDFPDENPAFQFNNRAGFSNFQPVKPSKPYSPAVHPTTLELYQSRHAVVTRLLGMDLLDRKKAEGELHRSIGALMEAYAWFDVHLGSILKYHAKGAPDVLALLKPSIPLKHRLDRLAQLVKQSPVPCSNARQLIWDEWLQKADEVRALRNDYAHGRWININPANNEFHFAPLNWGEQPESTAINDPVTPEKLDKRTSDIWKLTKSMDDVIAPFFK